MNWSYVAGFMDGEGSIQNYDRGNARQICVAFTQSEPQAYVLSEIQRFLAEHGIDSKLRTCSTKRKGQSQWCVLTIHKREHVFKFLKRVERYAIVKYQAVSELLAFIEQDGLRRPGQRRHDNFDLKEAKHMARLHKAGMSQEAIARQFSTYQVRVSRMIRRANQLSIPV